MGRRQWGSLGGARTPSRRPQPGWKMTRLVETSLDLVSSLFTTTVRSWGGAMEQ